VTPFHVAAALFALLILARNGRRALGLFARGDGDPPGGAPRLAGLVSLLACAAALAVLWVAVKGLAPALMNPPGGSP
jgi:hypothetical protein